LEIAADVRLGELAEEFTALSDNSDAEAWEAFEAVESMRAAGLRRQIMVHRAMAGRMPAEYAALVRQATVLARKALNGDATAAREAKDVEARLTRMEGTLRMAPAGRAGLGLQRASAERVAGELEPGQALISFIAGKRVSRVWVVTREGRATAALPPAEELTREVEAHRRAILEGRARAGRRLYDLLFGGIPSKLLERERWTVVADGPLWSVAWAALEPPVRGGGRFLVERRPVEMLPSASWLLNGGMRAEGTWLLAAGDAIHNRADGRFKRAKARAPAAALSFWVWPALADEASVEPLELPSLAGSARELAGVCEAWTAGPCRTLRGASLTYDRLAAEIDKQPSVVHLATHLLAGSNGITLPGAEQGFLALSLQPDLTREGLRPSDVSRMRVPGAVIVLSACESGRGAGLPGAGLQGFGRAWLAAGGRGVVGTLWPVADESNGFFSGFYRELAAGVSPAQALRRTQLRMIAAGGWSSNPRLWAAYMLLGKD
jgi:CHAT domain-containing protein